MSFILLKVLIEYSRETEFPQLETVRTQCDIAVDFIFMSRWWGVQWCSVEESMKMPKMCVCVCLCVCFRCLTASLQPWGPTLTPTESEEQLHQHTRWKRILQQQQRKGFWWTWTAEAHRIFNLDQHNLPVTKERILQCRLRWNLLWLLWPVLTSVTPVL